MKSFEDLKSNWQGQKFENKPTLDLSKLESKLSHLKRDQLIAPVILGITIAILLTFLFLQPKASFELLKNGLILMSASLFIRILFEIWSILETTKLNPTLEVNKFALSLTKFIKTRKLIHFMVTPIIMAIYILAFISLLPVFKLNVSDGMYQYILWSSTIVFIGLIIIKVISIPKELKLLNEMHDEL